MRNHLKAAAEAAEMTDAELLAIRVKMKDWEHPSALEEAVLDEIMLRRHSYRQPNSTPQQTAKAQMTTP